MMQELLKFMDCFGIQFSFYLDGKRKYYTIAGGILTTIALLICIISFFLLKIDDIKRKNPILYYTYELPYSKTSNHESRKILIPFRIINIGQNLINKDIFIIYNKKTLISKLCNETEFGIKSSNIYLNNNLDKLYCIEITEDQINSTIDSVFNNSVNLEIYLNDNTINDIKNYGIEILLPTICQIPKTFKNQFYINFKHYIYFFNTLNYKVDNLFLQKNIFINDDGWIYKNENIISFLSYNNINSNSYYKENNMSLLYSLNIKLESLTRYNVRSFMRLQNMLADSFPLFYLFFWVFQNIAKVLKLSEEKKKIFESLFENLIEKEDKFKLFANKIKENNRKQIVEEDKSGSKNDIFDNHQSNILSLNNKEEERSDNKSIILSKKFNKEIFHNIVNIRSMRNRIVSKNPTKIRSSFILPHKKLNLNPTKSTDRIFEKKPLFSYKFYLLSVICKNMTKINIEKLSHTKLPNKNLKIFLKLNNYIGHFLDLDSYIILQKEFNILKERLFKKKHFSLLEHDNKININDNLEIKRLMESIGSKKV